jgi:hypothetical protein
MFFCNLFVSFLIIFRKSSKSAPDRTTATGVRNSQKQAGIEPRKIVPRKNNTSKTLFFHYIAAHHITKSCNRVPGTLLDDFHTQEE